MEIPCCSGPSCSVGIAMKFCTWHDSCAVMACAKFSSDMMPYNGVTLKPIFHQIWIMMEKSFVKCVPGLQITQSKVLHIIQPWNYSVIKCMLPAVIIAFHSLQIFCQKLIILYWDFMLYASSETVYIYVSWYHIYVSKLHQYWFILWRQQRRAVFPVIFHRKAQSSNI